MKRNIKASGYFPKFALRTLLLLIIILSTFTVYAANYDFYVGGIYYKKSGTNVSVVSYTSSSSNYSGDISIPETVIYGGITYNVTTIGSYAFYGCSGLRSVVLPNSITTISYHAFNGCTSLTSINIPNSVTVLDYSAFQNCNALTSLTLGNSIESIGSSAFKGCIALTSIDLPNSLKTIGDYTFSDCGNMTSITIPDSVVSIGFCAFSNCSNLSEAIIGNSVISLGRFIFQGCTNLNSIEFGNSLIEIDYEAFDETAWYINQPDGLVYAGPVLYRYKGTMPDGTSLSLRDGTRGIATWAFYDCNGLTDITLPNSIISISDDAFSHCKSLEHINFPSSLTKIGDYAFNSCYSLSSIQIPSSVVSVGKGCFVECTGLTEVTIPNSITSISQQMFELCSSLTSVNIPNSVTTIGNYSFHNCSLLPSIDIPNSVTKIETHAFDGCSKFSEISIPNSVTGIYSGAFANCTALTKVNITSLESWCRIYFDGSFGNGTCNPCCYAHHLFLNGEEVTDLVIPNSITSIRGYAFDGCSSITSLTIPNTVTSIGENAFQSCTGLTSVTCLAATPPTISSSSTWPYMISSQTTLYVPRGTKYTYKNATNWDKFLDYVEIDIPASSINLDKTDISIILGESYQLTATVLPNETTNKDVSWASSNPNVATVTSDGLVNATGLGTATIIAMTTDGSNLCATCTVTVINPSILGDVNGNGMVNMDDLTALIDYLLTDNATGINLENADVDGSGNVGMDDLTVLVNYLLTDHW